MWRSEETVNRIAAVVSESKKTLLIEKGIDPVTLRHIVARTLEEVTREELLQAAQAHINVWSALSH